MGKELVALHSALKSVRFACKLTQVGSLVVSYSVVAVVITNCIEDLLYRV